MPQITLNHVRLNYVDEGHGPETIVFSHGLLMSHALFAHQIAHFRDRYRCIAFDHRGQAGSEVTRDGYDMDTLTEDAAALIEALCDGPVHFVGLSMGGFVGLRLALRKRTLLKSLILMDTSADPEPPASARKYGLLNFVARWFGLGRVVDPTMQVLFGQTFLNDPDCREARDVWRRHLVEGHDRIGITRAVRGVVKRYGVHEQLRKIKTPTHVIVGDEDVATLPEKGKRIADAIAGCGFELIARAGHSAPVEQPAAVNAAIERFLAAQS